MFLSINQKGESHNKRILVLGLDNSGKSSLIHRLNAKKRAERYESKPTEGFNIVCIETGNDPMNIWEGKMKLLLNCCFKNFLCTFSWRFCSIPTLLA